MTLELMYCNLMGKQLKGAYAISGGKWVVNDQSIKISVWQSINKRECAIIFYYYGKIIVKELAA